MRRETTWIVYYGDRFIDNSFRKTFKTERKSLEENPRWDEKSINRHMENIRECKIGITSNLKIRKNDLRYNEHTYIHKTIQFVGTYAQALLVESYLRFSIEQTFPMQVLHQGNDHFKCNNVNIMKSIINRFDDWVNEGMTFAKVKKVG